MKNNKYLCTHDQIIVLTFLVVGDDGFGNGLTDGYTNRGNEYPNDNFFPSKNSP